ncbi:WhiB family transcriptional regulator [Pedococcus sp. NPDC057267]|uniref:WhiB family transcriptional regulator n=1 Tax=Pedococcus sp. NPDC057267 TaxID=3346077 RepID=UPI00363BD988
MRKPDRLPAPLLESYAWQDDARCRTLPVGSFFDAELARGANRREREEAAKRVCHQCPVIRQCREHALAAEDFGVWGGLTAHEREVIRQRGSRSVRRATPAALKAS